MKNEYHGVTVNDLYNAIYKQFNMLVDEILSYESDTFSSDACDLTPAEAEQIAYAFVVRDIEQRAYCHTMDGGMISDELDRIRDGEEA